MPSSAPTEPLTLDEFPASADAAKRNNVSQGIEITLTGNTKVNDVAKAIQNAKSAQVSLGKNPAFVLDGKPTHPIQATSRYPILIYKKPVSSNGAKLAVYMSLKSASASKTSATTSLDADPAILALQESLTNFQRQKESNTTVFVKDNSRLPPAKSGKQAVKGNLAFLKNHRRLLSDSKATTRSMPASPSLGGLTPTSQRRDIKTVKQDALKIALLHLLAVQPISKKAILAKLKCTPDELDPLLERWQGKMEDNMYTLSDKGYKELDVWNFDYRDQSQRQTAIDRAIKAFDRQRISVRDNIWQMLLPKEERDKGKILSRLELHKGPIERVRTPQINVESSTGAATNSHSTSDDSEAQRGRLDPNTAKSHIRSSSQDPISKKRISEKEAQSKRLFAKDPKKAAQSAKAKESKPTPVAPPAKPAMKKATKATNSKVKSAEYVHSSDEDDVDMIDAPPPELPKKQSPKQPPVSSSSTASSNKSTSQTSSESRKKLVNTQKVTVKREIKKEPKAPAQSRSTPTPKPTTGGKTVAKGDGSASTGAKNGTGDGAQKTVPMARSLSHKRNNSSPMKPSPLGSSPPTNASDMENEQSNKSSKSSSSSNSPLINHRRDHEAIARKAPARTSAPTTENTDRGLKRKANDIDSDIHRHNGGSDISTYERPTKRHMSSSASSTRSDSPDDPMSLLSERNLEDSQKFMRQWQIYVKNLRELKSMTHPPREKVERLHRMHKKLTEHKSQIWERARKSG